MTTLTALRKRTAWRMLAVGLCLAASACVAATTRVVYPLTTLEDIDSRYEYDWAVLRMALEKPSRVTARSSCANPPMPCHLSAWRRSC
jgi:hypothetical protein